MDYKQLETKLRDLDERVAAVTDTPEGVSLELALEWWRVATTMRDMREAGCDTSC